MKYTSELRVTARTPELTIQPEKLTAISEVNAQQCPTGPLMMASRQGMTMGDAGGGLGVS